MADKVYRIKIITESSGAGADQARDALRGVGAAADQAAEHVDHATLSHKQLHKVIHGLSQVAPELGIAMQAVVNPITAAIVVSMMTLEHFKKQIEEIDAELKQLNDEEFAKHIERLHEQRMSLVASALAVEEFRAKLEEAAHAQQTINERMAESIADTKERSAAIAELATAEKDSRLAALAAFHAAGIGSEAEYQAVRIYLERKASAQRRQIAREEQAEILADKKKELDEAKSQNDLLAKVAAEKMGISAERQATAERRKKEADEAPKFLEAKQKELDAYFDKLTTFEKKAFEEGFDSKTPELIVGARATSQFTSTGGAIADYRKYVKLRSEVERAKIATESAPGAYQSAVDAALTAVSESDIAKARATENATFIGKTEREVTRDEAQQQRQAKQDARLNQMDATRVAADKYTAYGQDPIGRAVEQSSLAAMAMQHGVMATQDQMASVAQLQSILGANNMQMRNILQVLGQHATDMGYITREIETLKAQRFGQFNP